MSDMTPLWLDRPRRSHPPVSQDAAYDVLVVGGGITGVVTALLFARSGRSVALVEGREIGAATTGHTTAKVSLLQGTKLSRVLRRNPVSVAQDYVEANREGQAWLRRFCDDHGVAYQVRPAYTYAATRPGELHARAELAAANECGLDATWSDDPGLPFATRGAVRLDDQLQLHPMELLDGLVDQLLAEGGTVNEHSRVTGASRDGDTVRVAVGRATLTADHVVLATSMPILDRGGFFARLQPQRSYAVALRSSWVPPGMYLSADSPTRSIRSAPVDGDELLLVGGNGHVTGRGPSPAGQVEDLVDWARSELGAGETTHTWSAQDHAPVRRLPYVGPLLPGNDRVLVATGFDKWGFSNAPAAALLIAKEVLGDDEPGWGRALRTWTPWEATGLPTSALVNGSVGVRMIDGWLRPALDRKDAPADGEGVVRYDGIRPVAECTVDGVTHRVSAVCPHLHGIVRWNDAERSWDCPLHGSRFDADGSVLEGPTTRPLPPR